jgi:hypothetical protein
MQYSIKLINNKIAAATTIAGPVGISKNKEAIIPKIVVTHPKILPKIAIWVGLLAQILAIALGIINKALINNTPTNLIATTKLKKLR